MTREEAIAIRTQQLRGEPVKALVLQEAIDVIQATTPVRKGRPMKFRLPVLSSEERHHMNSVLLFNLGQAIGAGRVRA